MGSAAVQGDLWGRQPRAWAELQEPLSQPLWLAMLQAGQVGPGTRLLDAGCGSGGASALAATLGARISGLDAAAALISVARERLPEADFRIGDLQALPFGDDAFDAVVAASSLQYAEDRVAALLEMKRVCHSGGRVVIGLWSTPEEVDYKVVFNAVRDALPTPPPGKGPFELSGPGVLESLIEEAGMRVGESGKALCPFEYPSYEVFWRANLGAGPLQAALGAVGEEALSTAVREAVVPFTAVDGSIRMENRFRFVVALP